MDCNSVNEMLKKIRNLRVYLKRLQVIANTDFYLCKYGRLSVRIRQSFIVFLRNKTGVLPDQRACLV